MAHRNGIIPRSSFDLASVQNRVIECKKKRGSRMTPIIDIESKFSLGMRHARVRPNDSSTLWGTGDYTISVIPIEMLYSKLMIQSETRLLFWRNAPPVQTSSWRQNRFQNIFKSLWIRFFLTFRTHVCMKFGNCFEVSPRCMRIILFQGIPCVSPSFASREGHLLPAVLFSEKKLRL